MSRNTSIALGFVWTLLVALSSFAAGRASVPSAPIPLPPPAPVVASPTPPTLPPPAPALTPVQQLIVRAGADTERIAAMEPDARAAELFAWGRTGEPSYASLQRNTDAFFGERAVYRGRVEEIHDTAEGGSQMRIATRSGGQDVVWVETVAAPDRDIVAGSRVMVFGYIVGPFTYETQAGWNITLPAMMAVAVQQQAR